MLYAKAEVERFSSLMAQIQLAGHQDRNKIRVGGLQTSLISSRHCASYFFT